MTVISGNDPMVGLVGVGTMGSRMARALRDADLAVSVWDVSDEARSMAAQLGATVCSSSAEVAGRADIVLLSLPGPQEVRQVTAGEGGLLGGDPRPAYIVDLSTVDPGTSRDLEQLARSRGVRFVDAPVLGRPASCGEWVLPVGSPDDVVPDIEPVLGHLARRVVRVGPSGSGSALKLLNNLMFGAINAITCECMVGAERLGLDPRTFFSTVVDSGAATVSNLFRELGPKILARDWAPTFAMSLLEKDNRLGAEMLETAGVDATVARAVAAMGQRALELGLGAYDTCSLVELIGKANSPGAEP